MGKELEEEREKERLEEIERKKRAEESEKKRKKAREEREKKWAKERAEREKKEKEAAAALKKKQEEDLIKTKGIEIGATMKCLYPDGDGNRYSCVVKQRNEDNTFNVEWEDGDEEYTDNHPASHFRKRRKRKAKDSKPKESKRAKT